VVVSFNHRVLGTLDRKTPPLRASSPSCLAQPPNAQNFLQTLRKGPLQNAEALPYSSLFLAALGDPLPGIIGIFAKEFWKAFKIQRTKH
jgi:hypothetical protein